MTFNEVSKDLYIKLNNKYNKYNKIKAMKEIWNNIFHTPILKFDDFWEYDEEKGKLISSIVTEEMLKSLCGTLSTTETINLALILWRYNTYLPQLLISQDRVFQFLSLDNLYGIRKEKYYYLQEIFEKYPELFQQDL
jgi:hypothetical protein